MTMIDRSHTHTVLPADKLPWLLRHLVASHNYSLTHEYDLQDLEAFHRMAHNGKECLSDA